MSENYKDISKKLERTKDIALMWEHIDDKNLQYHIYQNPNVTPELLLRIHENNLINKVKVAHYVLTHKNFPQDVIESILLGDYSEDLKSSASSNPSIREEFLLEIVKNPKTSKRILNSILFNSPMTLPILIRILEDTDFDVNDRSNYGVSSLALTSDNEEILKYLIQKDIKVSVISRNLDLTTELMEKIIDMHGDNIEALNSIAKHKSATSSILEKLAEIEDKNIQSALARHKNSTIEILEKLSHHNLSEIRRYVARNRSVSNEVLEYLLLDRSKIVRNTAKANLENQRLRKA